ncbi:pre-mRNA 3'-end-processing factor FIP1 isoform X2 [Uranotaenia lowii]|uniref:pre-mRNA 3'-end-processing factor FIP1 isoform X2 n=1 Tax=Uranotaenia lowii TaxID=190385 RepID=UPI002478A7EA|nr:pre-mRNA 3'-end-processing factor FIP1 isoform X2 [Uranotaenia lowii]
MADEGNEDSWLYGNSENKQKPTEEEEEEEQPIKEAIPPEETADGDHTADGAKSDALDDISQSQWGDDGPDDGLGDDKQGLDSFSDDGHHQHDDNAMDASDLGRSRRRESDFPGEDDSRLQEDDSHDQSRAGRTERSDGEMDTDDSDDDDINVVIGDIKSGPSYNIIKQRGPIVPAQTTQAAPGQDKAKQPAGKFNIEEFESVGTINGVPAHEFSIDSLEEKPWRKPGADITDYFNYGFNEETWRAYCERQKRMRMHESGVGLQGLTINNPQAAQVQNNWRPGPPPPRKMNNGIDVIGGMNMHPRPEEMMMSRHPKENAIQVMTADRREYSRTTKYDPSMGPPPFGEFYPGADNDYGDYGYEPTQESQWNQEPNWQPHGIKTLTPGPHPGMMPPGMGMHMEMMPPPMQPGLGMGHPPMGPPSMNRGHDRDRDRGDRDRERDRRGRSREREHRDHRREHRDRHGEREHSLVKSEIGDPERSRREKSERDPDVEKDKRSKSDRHKDSRYRERSRSREKSKSRRRSRSRDRDRERERDRHSVSRSDKKKSHRKDKEEPE